MAPARRLSGLQKQVLSLYRQCLRAMRQQPTPEARAAGHAYVTAEFRKQAQAIRRMDVQSIEHHIRKGQRQLKAATRDTSAGFTVVQAPRDSPSLP